VELTIMASLLGLLASLSAFAQEAAPMVDAAAAAAEAAAQPDAVTRRLHFLVGAYSAVWIVLAVYLWTISMRLRRLHQAVRRIKESQGA
jgi:CcmD family protein